MEKMEAVGLGNNWADLRWKLRERAGDIKILLFPLYSVFKVTVQAHLSRTGPLIKGNSPLLV